VGRDRRNNGIDGTTHDRSVGVIDVLSEAQASACGFGRRPFSAADNGLVDVNRPGITA
jgi:hypothetical protein